MWAVEEIEPEDREVNEDSQRWVTAIHEAGHVIAVETLGYRVKDAFIDTDGYSGGVNHTLDLYSLDRAVVAVAGQRATRVLLGVGGGSERDYQQARAALAGTTRDLDWAEHQADALIRGARWTLLRTARRLYWRGQL